MTSMLIHHTKSNLDRNVNLKDSNSELKHQQFLKHLSNVKGKCCLANKRISENDSDGHDPELKCVI